MKALVLWLLSVAVVTGTYEAQHGGNDIIPGEFIVTFAKGTTPEKIDSLLQAGMFKSVRRHNFRKSKYAVVTGDEEIVTKLKDKYPEYITRVEPDRRIKLIEPVESSHVPDMHQASPIDQLIELISTRTSVTSVDSRPNRYCYAQYGLDSQNGWGLVRTSYQSRPAYSSRPYKYEHDGTGVDIYVLDSGVDIDHPDFSGRARQGMIAGDHQSEGPADLKGHGTHVAGIVAGSRYGVAKNASIVACKVLDQYGNGAISNAIEGIEWVVDDVMTKKAAGKPTRAIINLSLGGSSNVPEFSRAISDAVDEGIIFVVAAGNDRQDARSFFPSAYPTTISVASSSYMDQLSSFSNHGPGVDIIAPGSNIIAAGSGDSYDCSSRGADCYVKKSGTSMAAPHVAGIIARYLSGLGDEEAELVTHSSVLQRLIAAASLDKITFTEEGQKQTPNRLLFKDCEWELIAYDNSASSDFTRGHILWALMMSVLTASNT